MAPNGLRRLEEITSIDLFVVRVARGVKGGAKSLALSEPRHKVCFSKTGLTADTDETVTLLELAEAHGIEIDYAYRIGNCGECEVKFAGKVAEKGEFELAGKCKVSGLAYACCSVAFSDLEVEGSDRRSGNETLVSRNAATLSRWG